MHAFHSRRGRGEIKNQVDQVGSMVSNVNTEVEMKQKGVYRETNFFGLFAWTFWSFANLGVDGNHNIQ